MGFKENLSAAIKDSGINQSELARRAGIHHCYISNYLSGKRNISLETACKIADALGVSVVWLLGREDERIDELNEIELSKYKSEYNESASDCPFCGEKPIVKTCSHSEDAFVVCEKCKASVHGDTLEEAISTWNKRYIRKCVIRGIGGNTDPRGGWECSVCGHRQPYGLEHKRAFNYCPNCGSMQEELAGTCHVEESFFNESSRIYKFLLSCGHSFASEDNEKPKFCNECGSKVL